MEASFLSQFSSAALSSILFLVMAAVYFVSAKAATKRQNETHFGPVEGAVTGLLALLLAFTFSLSASRYDMRRQVIVQEANAIGTATLRSDLYPEPERSAFRADFKEYVEARIAFYAAGTDKDKLQAAHDLSTMISTRLWKRAAELAQDRDSIIRSNNMVPALNQMIDVVATRNVAGLATVPDSILWVLFALCILCSSMLGSSQGQKLPWWTAMIFIVTCSASVLLILDFDRPRRGSITLDTANSNIVALRELFKDDR